MFDDIEPRPRTIVTVGTVTAYQLLRDLFVAGAISCFLLAAHRIGRGLLAQARVSAYHKLEQAYTPEEREALIHKIKSDSLHV